jgi:hypothetical protein
MKPGGITVTPDRASMLCDTRAARVWRVIGSKIVTHKLCRRIECGQSRGKRVGNRSARRFLSPRAYFNKEDGVHF